MDNQSKLIISSLLLLSIFIISGCSHDPLEKINQTTNETNITFNNLTLEDRCFMSLADCSNIAIERHGGSIILLEQELFNDSETAYNFFELWKQNGVQGSIYGETTWTKDYPNIDRLKYPAVFFALGFNGRFGSVAYVASCSNNGTLFIKSQKDLGCTL